MTSDVNQGLLLCCKFAKNDNYNPKVDLVKGNAYTKFGLSKSIRSQDIEKMNSNIKQGPLICCKFVENDDLPSKRRSCFMIMCIQKLYFYKLVQIVHLGQKGHIGLY